MLQFAAVILLLASGSSYGEQVSQLSPREQVRIYSTESGLRLPELQSLHFSPIPTEQCKSNIDGDVVLSLLIDTAGRARNIMFVHPVGNDADVFAIQIASEDQFTPGTLDGKAVVTARSLEVKVRACQTMNKDDAGKIKYGVRLRSLPTQELKPPVDLLSDAVLAPNSPILDQSVANEQLEVLSAPKITGENTSKNKASRPIILFQPLASYTEAARKAKITGTCIVSAIVDAHGLPQHLRVTKSLDSGLDRNALLAVSQYRFKPSIRDGEPVPVVVAIAVNFRLL